MVSRQEIRLTEPKDEAAFFYGLFLRGHPIQKLRSDIDIPPHVVEHWQRHARRDPETVALINRILAYRKHVLAIFDSLVFNEIEPAPTIQ